MATYAAPVRDLRFVLHEMLDVSNAFSELEGLEAVSDDLLDAILEEAGKLCENVLFPLYQKGDEAGCTLAHAQVTSPPGFADAYKALTEGGWTALSCAPEYGGQGLPETVKFAVEEMICSANMALSLYPGLTHGAYRALTGYASAAIKDFYLPKMVSGEWSGTMCLTESHCGTDLGLMRTRAEPQDDGSFLISGTKIFITGGEQDFTDNIIHLVLAKIPGGPPGIRGVSLFLVPKFLPDADGDPGARNPVFCGALEKKMGIKGASTCVMNFEGARGWLVGEQNKGMRAMFSMMNHERLWVGMQGLSLGVTAYQSAAEYAKERVQGRSPSGPVNAQGSADPIIVHPDVRRMLMTTRAYMEGGRALYLWVASQLDRAAHHPDPQVRAAGDKRVALLTPVVKAFLSDVGTESAIACQQVFGGHGYIREWGMEQIVRDARITQIYEGTNGVQAMDLVGRKLPMEGGAVMRDYLDELRAAADSHAGTAAMVEFIAPFRSALARLEEAFDWLMERAATDPSAPGASATEFLRLMGLTGLAHMWVAAAATALEKMEGDNTGFYAAKLTTARFFMQRLLPQGMALLASIRAGSESLMALEAEAF
ncbi:MAG: acyl-CoA dehydrogenase [Gammaproteobacteria bacterium]|nr:acyl-CoA dehydrogenase [Gammaproteobacteria bacterium]